MVRVKNSTQKGFTIVEVLVAVVIFAVAVITIVSLTNFTRAMNARSRANLLVSEIIYAKVESLRSSSFDSLINGTTAFTSELPSMLGSPRSATYTVADESDDLKRIDLNVSYTIYGAAQSVDYKTYISELVYE